MGKIIKVYKVNQVRKRKDKDNNPFERGDSMFVIRGKSGYKFFSTEPGTYGQEVQHETRRKAESMLKVAKDTLPFEEFEIVEV